MPFFSVIIPSYNRASCLDNVFESLLSQTFSDYEIIIVDDGSTDNTRDTIAPYLENPNIHYHYQPNGGVCAARNYGAKKSTGSFLVFLDSDDKVTPNWLSDFYNTLQTNIYDVCYCNMLVVFPDGKTKQTKASDPYNNGKGFGINIPGSWAIKRALFFNAGMYDESIKFSENSELRLRISLFQPKEIAIDKYNLIYNKSSDGGGTNNLNKLNSLKYILKKHKHYYDDHKYVRKKYLQVAAVAAARLCLYKEAHNLFGKALKENRTDKKLWLQYLISFSGFTASLLWKPVQKKKIS